ncbi:hypothetical protein GCM10027578_38670 [Spirosoma luteolum]
MKSVIALLLSCWLLAGSLLPGFGLDQSTHWGDLMTHYREHRRQIPDLSFGSFLLMHYGADSDHLKHPNHPHTKLPASSHLLPVYTPAFLRLAPPLILAFGLWFVRAVFLRKVDLYAFVPVFALMNPPRA